MRTANQVNASDFKLVCAITLGKEKSAYPLVLQAGVRKNMFSVHSISKQPPWQPVISSVFLIKQFGVLRKLTLVTYFPEIM